MPLLTVLPPSHHTFNLPELQIRDVADFQHTIAPIQQKEIDTLTKRLLDRVSQSPPPGCTAIQPIFILIPPPTNFRPVSAPLVEDAQTTHQQQLLRRKESKLAKQQGGEEKKKKQPQKKTTTTTTTATGKRRGRPPNKKVNLLEPMPPRLPPPPPVPVPPVHKLRQPRPMSDSDSEDDDDADDENDTANKTKKHKAEEPKKVAAATLPLMLPTSICTLPTQPTKKCLQPVPFAFGFFFEPRKQQQQQQQQKSS